MHKTQPKKIGQALPNKWLFCTLHETDTEFNTNLFNIVFAILIGFQDFCIGVAALIAFVKKIRKVWYSKKTKMLDFVCVCVCVCVFFDSLTDKSDNQKQRNKPTNKGMFAHFVLL